ncbi:unnamed protein product [Orchesella dallaii]|uniref:Uncharacterized protein n=1 Tax=Orchesella dallaii TaxID=48710 RepID=A0ABP1RK39_9HEXA
MSSIQIILGLLFPISIMNIHGSSLQQQTYYISPINKTSKGSSLLDYYRKHDRKNEPQSDQILNVQTAFPDIQIEQILSTFTSTNCYVSISNFRFVNINPGLQPLAIRAPELSELSGGRFHLQKFPSWMPKDFHRRGNVTVPIFPEVFECNSFRHLLLTSDMICLQVDFFQYSTQIRPWNCWIDISLYPPNIPKIEDYPEPLDIDSVDNYRKALIYHRVPAVKVFVNYDTNQYSSTNILRRWVNKIGGFDSKYNSAVNMVFLLVRVKASETKDIGILFAKIISVEAVKICYHCFVFFHKYKEYHRVFRVHMEAISTNKKLSIEQLSEVYHPNPDELLHWHIAKNFGTAYKPSETIGFYLFLCKKYPKQGFFDSSIQSETEKLAYAYATVLLSIMKNATYYSGALNGPGGAGGYNCDPKTESKTPGHTYGFHSVFSLETDIFTKFTPYGRAVYIPIHLGALTFVSCGRRQLQSIPFSELVNVYDNSVWVCGVITLLVLMYILNRLIDSSNRQFCSFFSQSLPLIKVLVEQGDPFPAAMLRNYRIAPVIAVFLLVGIVLSNGYKNTNVYNMIAPRKPVPYIYFHELTNDNFTIYSRTAAERFSWYDWEIPRSSNIKITRNEFYERNIRDRFFVMSEIYMLWGNADSELRKRRSKPYTKSEIELINLLNIVDEHSAMHPNLSQVFRRRVEEVEALNPVPKFSFPNVTSKLSKSFWREQNDVLDKFISKCDRRALVLPNYLCWEYARSLKKLGYPDVYVGDEAYTNPTYVFSLTGLVPPFVVTRLSGIQEAGIWGRFSALFDDKSRINDTLWNGVLEKPTLEGNVLLIFSVWSIGEVVAVLCFFCEIWRILRSCLYVTFNLLKQKLTDVKRNCKGPNKCSFVSHLIRARNLVLVFCSKGQSKELVQINE